jgi:hypothetical protein
MSSKNFNEETLLKVLSEISEHQKCPYFQDEVVRLVRDLVNYLNDPQILPAYMFKLKIARRQFSS